MSAAQVLLLIQGLITIFLLQNEENRIVKIINILFNIASFENNYHGELDFQF